jgi:hypothetical protein
MGIEIIIRGEEGVWWKRGFEEPSSQHGACNGVAEGSTAEGSTFRPDKPGEMF